MIPKALSVLLLGVVLALVSACGDERAASTPTTPLYVAIGASDAVGTGARNPTTEGWVPQLYQKLPAGTRLANLGIGGLRLRQAVDQVLPVAVDLKPSIVTVWLGVNDLAGGVALDAYGADLDRLLGALANQTNARVYIANLPDLTLLPAFFIFPKEQVRAQVQQWNAVIAERAAANGATLVDLYAGWTELRERTDYISADGLHPSTAGHRRLAELFWQTISTNERS